MKTKECTGQIPIDFGRDYRNNEPTSKAADEKIGKMKATQCQQVYTVIRNICNGATSQEIAQAGNIPNEVVHKRLATLKANKHIREGQPRKCKVTGNVVKTWWII